MSWKQMVDTTMDALVVPSFTRLGYSVRARLFDWEPSATHDLSGKTVVLTGPTSGLGLAAADALAGMGASLVLVARNAEKVEALAARLAHRHPASSLATELADLADLDQVRAACDRIARRHPRIDALLHNAGALFNQRREAPDGSEATTQVMVVAPFLMTTLLLGPLKAAAPGRVIMMSSGGMYLAPLTVSDLQLSAAEYSGAKQYALAKRAQVVLNELWAERVPARDVVFHALHPGWADTPGVAEALPRFRRIMRPLLRTPIQGADTLVWLTAADQAASTTGRFWLDRAERATHRRRSTRASDTEDERQALWDWCVRQSGARLDDAA